jgi:hypothetical protein
VLATTKSLLVREREVQQQKLTTNTIEQKRTTVDKEDNNSLKNPDNQQLTSGFFILIYLIKFQITVFDPFH